MGLARDVVIVDFLRSPFSRSNPKDAEKDLLNSWQMQEVLALLWNELIKRNKLDPKEIDEAITGTAAPVLENFIMGGKFPLFFAQLPVEIASQQVDQQCGSALCAIRTGVMSIACGYSDVVLIGGIEHMTHVPSVNPGVIYPTKLFEDPKYKYLDMPTATNMGFCAQKQQEMTGISRKEMDEFAYQSHHRAAEAQKSGWFKGEIMPVEITLADGTKKMFDYDACVRPDTTLEALLALRPAYREGAQITAGNSSPRNAGSTAMLIMSREKAKKLGYKPIASFVSFGMAGVDPTIMGTGPIPSTKKALAAAGLKASDIDYWEINEAFSIVALHAIHEFNIDWNHVNVHGGAMAIGHPLGASGPRLVGTLARILKEKKGKYGCATMCEGGGQGIACIIKSE